MGSIVVIVLVGVVITDVDDVVGAIVVSVVVFSIVVVIVVVVVVGRHFSRWLNFEPLSKVGLKFWCLNSWGWESGCQIWRKVNFKKNCLKFKIWTHGIWLMKCQSFSKVEVI